MNIKIVHGCFPNFYFRSGFITWRRGWWITSFDTINPKSNLTPEGPFVSKAMAARCHMLFKSERYRTVKILGWEKNWQQKQRKSRCILPLSFINRKKYILSKE